MISGQVDRLRTAAQTYRRLGNHSAESMFLDAADTILELCDDLQRANAENASLREQVDAAHMSRLLTENENAKLRELVDGLTWCCEHHCRQECPLYDVFEPDHCREASIKRELGIEVDE